MPKFRVTLAEKPADLLVYLVDHGPASALDMAAAFGVGGADVYTGGLNVLDELGLVAEPNQSEWTWRATDEGRLLVETARMEAAA